MAKKGWFGEKQRHSLAARGIKTGTKKVSIFRSPKKIELGMSRETERKFDDFFNSEYLESSIAEQINEDLKYEAFGDDQEDYTAREYAEYAYEYNLKDGPNGDLYVEFPAIHDSDLAGLSESIDKLARRISNDRYDCMKYHDGFLVSISE